MSDNALIPGPALPVRCVCCRHWIRSGPVIQGLGEKCARDRGLLPAQAPRPAKPVRDTADDGPNLLDLIEEANGNEADLHEESRTPIGHRGAKCRAAPS